ncbi:RAC GTPase, putative [Entamoeba invadens IP1]|uniref:RAC GTPase, putative n=1 Tax=Entamoeba invadens IP1 TaxID=370355 RepID=UPI0002C3EDD7|nr:RAC GTPase, putative [Entamoeba invadens IP1]ELP90792.1 RAC GTPase, putative [Entamoeba invadens IP1]|eukprot:XP_004257563.1 RAC GTPase, putative [Entamoeba invadens IP1]
MTTRTVPVKLVTVGDGAVGKTSLLISYTQNSFPTEYIPTVFDNYSAFLMSGKTPVNMSLWDTAGQHEYDQMRPLSYPGTHCFLICFSIISRASFENVEYFWIPEIRKHSPTIPFLLVGTKGDMREDITIVQNVQNGSLQWVSYEEANNLSKKYGGAGYFECSALTQKNLKLLFDQAITTALKTSFSTTKTRKDHTSKCAIF